VNRLPIIKPRQLIHALEKLGFELVRKSPGSHWQFAHADGRRTTVPVHKGKDIGPGLLRKILRDIELSDDALRDWL
jgi:predicted RNA binding protein YcfA (HicA-like mRNA interferase family)